MIKRNYPNTPETADKLIPNKCNCMLLLHVSIINRQ